MPSFSELSLSTGKSVLFSDSQIDSYSKAIVATTGSITHLPNYREALKTTHSLMGYGIALNELMDVGNAMNTSPYSQHEWLTARGTRQTLATNLQIQRERILRERPDCEPILDTWFEEAHIISNMRDVIKGNRILPYVETDSLHYSSAFWAVLSPDILEAAGIHYYKPAEDYEEIIRKYDPIRPRWENYTTSSNAARRLQGVSANTLDVKVFDDLMVASKDSGENVDTYLRIPGYYDWALSQDQEDPHVPLRSIRSEYRQVAIEQGWYLPNLAAELFASTRSWRLPRRLSDEQVDVPSDHFDLLVRDSLEIRSSLRDKWFRAGVFHNLFPREASFVT